MAISTEKEVDTDLQPLLRTYKDGTVERLLNSPFVPSSMEGTTASVFTKDITISPGLSVRLYLPNIQNPKQMKLPILVYFHAGGFCVLPAFSFFHHNYVTAIAAQAKAIILSVEYRQAPEHPLPIAYEDCWFALNWVASHSIDRSSEKEKSLVDYGDFDRVYLGGDSAGGNIVHNMALRAGVDKLDGGVKLLGGFLSHPYFWGSKPIGSEPYVDCRESFHCRLWLFVYPSAPGGIDNPMINPLAEEGLPGFAGLGCSRLLVVVSEKDELRERGVGYFEAVKGSGWKGEVELVEVEGEGHCFHVLDPNAEKAKILINRLASFIK